MYYSGMALQENGLGAACSPDLSPTENIWFLMKRKIRQRRSRSVEQLELYIKQE